MRFQTWICLAVVSGAAALTSFAGAERKAEAVKPADERHVAAFEKLKGLAGEWTMTDEKGQTKVASVYRVSSNGSIVVETMFPGSEHEMTNVYHLDGPSIVMTHYCAIGNQPRMRATCEGNANELDFRFESVTNYTDAEKGYMGEMRLVFKDADTIEQHWKHRGGEKKPGDDHSPVFTLKRKK